MIAFDNICEGEHCKYSVYRGIDYVLVHTDVSVIHKRA